MSAIETMVFIHESHHFHKKVFQLFKYTRSQYKNGMYLDNETL